MSDFDPSMTQRMMAQAKKVFDPNFTQTIVLKAKEESTVWGKALAVAHKTLPIYFYYLVGLSVTLQSAVPDLADYVPDKIRHWIIGIATGIVFIDKIIRSRPKVGDRDE